MLSLLKPGAPNPFDVAAKERAIAEAHAAAAPPQRLRLTHGSGGVISQFWFLPYHDGVTGETAAMRAAYRQMLRSPAVKSGIFSKVLSVASLDYQFHPAVPDSPRDMEACDFIRFNYERIPMGVPGLCHTLLTHPLVDGRVLAEPVLEPETEDARWRGKIVLNDVKPKHPDLYELHPDAYGNPVAVKGKGPNAGDVWPIKDFVYHRHLPLYDDPMGTSDLRAAYQAYFMRDTVTKLRAISAEKWTSPMLKGTYDTDDAKPGLEAALERAKGNTWMAIPLGTQVEALAIASRGESDFKSFVDDCDRQILIALCGAYLQVMEGQVSDGTGNSQVSKSITELFQWWLLVTLQEVANKQLTPLLMRLNYAGVGSPKMSMGGLTEEEVKKILENIILAQSAGLQISKKHAYSRTGMQMPSDEADVLEPVAPAGLGMGLPAPGGFGAGPTPPPLG